MMSQAQPEGTQDGVLLRVSVASKQFAPSLSFGINERLVWPWFASLHA